MKKILAFLAASLLLLTFKVSAQAGITITPQKITYKRQGRGIEHFKRTFSVRYPIIRGTLKPAVKTRLEKTISYWRVFEITLAETFSETGLDTLDYTVNYNQNDILDITLTEEFSAAYPSTQNYNLVVDLKTGRQIKFADVFKTATKSKLAQMVDKKLEAEKQEILTQIESDKDETKESKDWLKEQIAALSFTAESFNEFRVGSKGVTILYDAGFPHVIQALQPNGEYFFTYSQLKPFLKPGGLLGKFVR